MAEYGKGYYDDNPGKEKMGNKCKTIHAKNEYIYKMKRKKRIYYSRGNPP